MAGYTIKDLERLSGVKAHTIRIWEKRYGIITPNRTDTNIRRYNDEDLKSILNIAILRENGYKISEIVSFNNKELSDHVLNFTTNPRHHSTQINNLILAMIELDDRKFDKVITNSTVRTGFEETILNVVYPFLEKIGILWQIGSVNAAQEHFVSNLLRQKLLVALDGQMSGNHPEAKRFMLFLPESEYHELGLLFFAYIVRKNGHKIIYLGQSVPIEDVVEVAKMKEPDYIITSVTAALDHESLDEFIKNLASHFSKQIIFFSGLKARDYNKKLPENFIVVKDVNELKQQAVFNQSFV
ncbi:MAG: MerR family transcriptional regulator [Bacteroidales bacterium]|nr:MerR family transcriptional regulator [Bacteroidales bacterium]MCF8339152.1 MerR family transcriptional regulator [Bacteroidales bacterium]